MVSSEELQDRSNNGSYLGIGLWESDNPTLPHYLLINMRQGSLHHEKVSQSKRGQDRHKSSPSGPPSYLILLTCSALEMYQSFYPVSHITL